MSGHDWRYWILLSRVRGLGDVGIRTVLQHFGSPEALFNADSHEIAAAGIPPKISTQIQTLEQNDGASVERELSEIEKFGARLVTFLDIEYPVLLKEIHNPPPALYVKGTIQPRDSLALSIVGSRRAGEEGLILARRMARALADRGLTIVSGLALGVDCAAHQGALLSEGGRTLAVLGNGLCQGPPRSNQSVADEVEKHGAILSEFPMMFPASKSTFPRRNRIIAGLSLGTLVIHAPERSGALITARYAREQGREVFAAPGRPTDLLSAGCNRLIADGAHMATSSDDVMNVLEDLVSRWRSRSEVSIPRLVEKRKTPPQAKPAPPPPRESTSGTAANLSENDSGGEADLPVRHPAQPNAARSATPRQKQPEQTLDERIIARLDAPTQADELAREFELTPSQLAVKLLQLEMAGRIQRLPGNRFVVV